MRLRENLVRRGEEGEDRLRVDWRIIIMKNLVISLKMGLMRLLGWRAGFSCGSSAGFSGFSGGCSEF